ncbi:MAG TPA: type ISP restriction/modification enzyme [Pseudoxanthomonas sp.]
MSKVLIGQYLNDLSRLRQASGSYRESVVREAFKDLLKGYARSQDLTFVPEYEIESPRKERRYVDGALLHGLRLPFGYWEAKDEKDDLDAEIALKFQRGYPKDNIIFDDSIQAVLIQNGIEVIRCKVDDVDSLQKLLQLFFGYQRPEIAEFRKAVEQFTTDLPAVLQALREMIDQAHGGNDAFRKAAEDFLQHARETINPDLGFDDVREILIQHILTDEIFDEVFPGQPFHKDNNVARELQKLEDTFFTGNTKFQTLKALEIYYRAIRGAASRISGHHEKQTFLKVVYENFYKVYNPKAADRLGVVYTPGEIVRFMIESADWLCEQHFKRNLIDRDVEILDPAVGTGTFITELIEHFRGQPEKLKHKYAEELHANEVGILPYYVANLNIEATYAAVMGRYDEFPGLCLVDTLDNTGGLGRRTGDQISDLFGMGDANVERIKRQNKRKISVIIGNPPYNANQANENDNNKNREYPEIDQRIKDSYIKASTAQKTKLYDMYSRFFRWASDRMHDDGVLAFITNRSFLDARTFDGFRKVVAQEFAEIHLVDLGGDVRANPKLSGTTHNVFGIQTGVAISFLVKKRGSKGARIFYTRRPETETAEEKLIWLSRSRLGDLEREEIRPDAKGYWLNVTSSDFEELLPLRLPGGKGSTNPRAIFRQSTNGINTARDEWVYDYDKDVLLKKISFLANEYNKDHQAILSSGKFDRGALSARIKWSEGLLAAVQRDFVQGQDVARIASSMYRPFCETNYYWDQTLSDRLTSRHVDIFGHVGGERTPCIAISAPGPSSIFRLIAIDRAADWHFMGDTQLYPARMKFQGETSDNITDWALKQFRDHYRGGKGKLAPGITKQAIFHYVYAVLHDPVYREKYMQNLKREFPRIPLHGKDETDFLRWAGWGQQLMALHVGYEFVKPWPLVRTDIEDDKARAAGQSPKALLKADKPAGRIVLDSETTLAGIPPLAWTYLLGNRSALEWVLDQHKEKTPRDPAIRDMFDAYRFADHKDRVIDLIARITRVSVETMALVEAMRSDIGR